MQQTLARELNFDPNTIYTAHNRQAQISTVWAVTCQKDYNHCDMEK